MAGAADDSIQEVRAQAAAWLARLRSDERLPEDQAGFQSWLEQDGRHQAVFEAITATWDLAGGARLAWPMRETRVNASRRGVLIGASLVAAGALGGVIWFVERGDIYETGVGEQRRVALADGSWLILDTDTKLSVSLGRERRAVILERGRAYFDVAPDAMRPFVVNAGNHDVVVVGTAFDVERAGKIVSVTLERGHVLVRSPQAQRSYELVPGDRIAFAPDQAAHRDRPDLSLVMAWRSGRLGFESETLAQAVAEMNRYGGIPIVIADPAIANLRISGVYTAGDSADFARSITLVLPVTADVRISRVVLTAAPQKIPSPP